MSALLKILRVHFSARSQSLRMSAEQIEDILSGRSPRHHDVTSPRKQRRSEQERQELLRWMEERKAQRMREFRKEQQGRKETEVNPYKPPEDSKNMVRLESKNIVKDCHILSLVSLKTLY